MIITTLRKVQRAFFLIEAHINKIATPILFDAENDSQGRESITVYRIENSKGQGPFYNPLAWNDQDDYNMFNSEQINLSFFKSITLPAPHEDKGLTEEERLESNWKDKYFAFSSKEAVKTYITPKMWSLLHKNDFQLKPVEASFVVHSPTSGQVYYVPA